MEKVSRPHASHRLRSGDQSDTNEGSCGREIGDDRTGLIVDDPGSRALGASHRPLLPSQPRLLLPGHDHALAGGRPSRIGCKLLPLLLNAYSIDAEQERGRQGFVGAVQAPVRGTEVPMVETGGGSV
jgi:hypothetical protein